VPEPFLSDAWFARVEEIRAGLADQSAPGGWEDLDVNVLIEDAPGGDDQYRLIAAAGGFKLSRGQNPDTQTIVTMPVDIAKALFVDGDGHAAIGGFFDGSLKVEGNLAALMPLQYSVTALTGSRAEFHQLVKEATA
jgi:hypothetical protein